MEDDLALKFFDKSIVLFDSLVEITKLEKFDPRVIVQFEIEKHIREYEYYIKQLDLLQVGNYVLDLIKIYSLKQEITVFELNRDEPLSAKDYKDWFYRIQRYRDYYREKAKELRLKRKNYLELLLKNSNPERSVVSNVLPDRLKNRSLVSTVSSSEVFNLDEVDLENFKEINLNPKLLLLKVKPKSLGSFLSKFKTEVTSTVYALLDYAQSGVVSSISQVNPDEDIFIEWK